MTLRDVVKVLDEDGWRLDCQVGSHRQYRHPTKPGTVTIAGQLGNDAKPGTLGSIWKQAQIPREQRP
jgi:predicted RNA binding protein YcfA (HicA-like mRNA interferase family)